MIQTPAASPSSQPSSTYSLPTPSEVIPKLTPTTGQELTATMTVTPTPPPKYFTEEWNGATDEWTWFSTKGNDNLWDVYTEAGVLVFYLTGKNIDGYFIYKPQVYDKVMITTQVENRAFAKGTFVIICNYSETLGWYEFDIGSDGLWALRAHDTQGNSGYLDMLSGGSKSIRTRFNVNEYSATCDGAHLTLIANGQNIAEFTDTILNLKTGKIGLGVLSTDQVPVLMESAWVRVNQP